MASGIFLPASLAVAASSLAVTISEGDNSFGTSNDVANTGPWTPPQYGKPALTILTVPASGSPQLVQAATATSAPIYRGGTPAVNYVFDAVFKVRHNRKIVKTQHPVLTGANITDHAYVMPSRVTLEIGMSDSMSSFINGIWVGAATKSISAWQILKGLQLNRTLLSLTTRLDTYTNMLILDIDSPDDNKTLHALRATVILEENISASVSSTQGTSARSQTTDTTSSGIIQSVSPSDSQVQQNVIPSPLWPDTPTYPNVPGASNVSSNSLGQIP